MSDFILARVSQTLAAEQSLETLVRQLLEMLEAVTRMESTYLTRIDTNAQRQQIMFAHNSSEMQIPEGFSVPWDESLCKRALEDQCTFSNDVANRWHSCIAARGSWESLLFKHSRPPRPTALCSAPSAPPAGNNSLITSKANRSWACLRSSFPTTWKRHPGATAAGGKRRAGAALVYR